MIKIRFLNASVALALIVAFSGCSGPAHTSESTTSTQTNQPTTQSTTNTTNADITRDIVVELDFVGDATLGLVGIGQVEATCTKNETIITGPIFSIRNTIAKVTMTAEFYDSSRISIGTSIVQLHLYGAIELDYKEFLIKFFQNPSEVDSCILTVTAYEGVD
jgi:hypothetical protein